MNKSLKLMAIILLVGIVATACAPAAQPAAEEAPAVVEEAVVEEAVVEEAEAYEPMVLTSPDCDYGGSIKEIAALDASTVQFTMCVPDPAFPSKAAFTAFAIQPKEWIETAMASGEILEKPVGTGPYVLDTWNRGDSIIFKKFADYWGDAAKTDTLVFKWASEGAQRKLELESGTVDGIDNPTPDDFDDLKANDALSFYPREAMNIFYIAFTNTFEPFNDVNVRKAVALGIDRQRIVDNFYPKGSEVASHFTPCSIPNGCTGEEWHAFDLDAAKAMLTDAGFADGFETTIYYRDVVRSYLPEPGIVATDIQAQLADLGITAAIEVMESGAFIEESNAGRLDGIYLLGWGADFPHVVNFLDFHFAASNPQFGDPYAEVYEPLQKAAQIADPAVAKPFYVEANNALKETVPMIPVAHGGSATVFQADAAGAHSSPLGNEYFAVVDPGGRDTMVWMQNAEPISVYCNDETDGESLRACEQVTESLLAYEVGATDVKPSLATSCDPNEDLTVWTCNLREGVKFHDGSSLDANDVVMSWVVAWDASNPLHVGNTGAFSYFTYLWGNLLNAE
jgi:peptide/nickel transport system substrate-binding protein